MNDERMGSCYIFKIPYGISINIYIYIYIEGIYPWMNINIQIFISHIPGILMTSSLFRNFQALDTSESRHQLLRKMDVQLTGAPSVGVDDVSRDLMMFLGI